MWKRYESMLIWIARLVHRWLYAAPCPTFVVFSTCSLWRERWIQNECRTSRRNNLVLMTAKPLGCERDEPLYAIRSLRSYTQSEHFDRDDRWPAQTTWYPLISKWFFLNGSTFRVLNIHHLIWNMDIFTTTNRVQRQTGLVCFFIYVCVFFNSLNERVICYMLILTHRWGLAGNCMHVSSIKCTPNLCIYI